MQTIGIHAIVVLLTYLATVGFSFWALKALNLEKLFRPGHTGEIQIMIVFLALALGYLVGSLVIEIMDQSLNLRTLFV